MYATVRRPCGKLSEKPLPILRDHPTFLSNRTAVERVGSTCPGLPGLLMKAASISGWQPFFFGALLMSMFFGHRYVHLDRPMAGGRSGSAADRCAKRRWWRTGASRGPVWFHISRAAPRRSIPIWCCERRFTTGIVADRWGLRLGNICSAGAGKPRWAACRTPRRPFF